MDFESAYDPKKYEADIYHRWEERASFVPKDTGEPYAILMPPPNANANLHLGHALTVAIQDTLIRYRRLKGDAALYLPGSDHAGFETQVVYERKLEREGDSRFNYSRDELYEQIYDFVQSNKGNMEAQVKALGASADWSRNTFTLDDRVVERVYATFKRLWDDELIYRGHRIVNYCTYHQTSFSELEVEYRDEKSKLWHINYPLEVGEGYITVATTRPETMLGDTAVAVHPEDKRYKELLGKAVIVPLTNRPIPVIPDEAVEREFGTGAVKVTPAHDLTDFEIGERHDLPHINLLNHDGTMSDEVPGPYRGLTVEDARAMIVKDLKDGGFLEKEEKYEHSVGHCYKCGTVIEPVVRDQWLVNIKPLAERAVQALDEDEIAVIPSSKKRTLYSWLHNIRDWNISRQIAWGIPIPAFHNVDDPTDWIFDTRVKEETIEVDGKTYARDLDVFDTWFSSGQWPLATLNYPGDDFQRFYPTSVMETGADIIFFWVARMIMLGLYVTGEVPFKTIYLHGMVTDPEGKKMSKSKGNVIDPMDTVEKYGSDAVRMGLLAGRSPGLNQAFDEAKVVGGRNFANKLWNVARYIDTTLADGDAPADPRPVSTADNWIIHRLGIATGEIGEALEQYRFTDAYETLYGIVWNDFADWYLETSKVEPNPSILVYSLKTILTLAHPFAPFVTEAIWQKLDWCEGDLITAVWPEARRSDTKAADHFGELQNIVTEIRTLKSELSLNDPALYHHGSAVLEANQRLIEQLAGVSDIAQVEEGSGIPLAGTTIDCWLGVDHRTVERYQSDLQAKRDDVAARVDSLEARLANKGYTRNAPKEVVQETKEQLKDAQTRLESLSGQLENLDQSNG